MTTKEFVTIMASQKDGELAKKMTACKNPDEAYKVAKAAGVTDTKEEFTKVMTEFNEALKKLSDKDLADVAGGADWGKVGFSAAACVTMAVATLYAGGVIGGAAAAAAV